MHEPSDVHTGDVSIRVTDLHEDVLIRGEVALQFVVRVPRGAMDAAADLDGLISPAVEALQRMHDDAAERFERRLPGPSDTPIELRK